MSAFEDLVKKHFSLENLVVLLVGDGIGLSLCIAGGEAAVNEHWRPTVIGFGVGLPLMAIASSFPFWKSRAAAWLRHGIVTTAMFGLPVGVLLAIVYVLGPNLFVAQAPSADDIARAVVRNLPKGPVSVSDDIEKATAPLRVQIATLIRERDAARPPAAPNPLRSEVVKWQAVSRLVDVSKKENLKCKVMLARSPLPYAEDYATDLKLILDAARWDYEVTIAVGELEKELSARAPFEPGIKRRCAEAFERSIRNSRENWPAGAFLSWQDASRPLDQSVKDCPECFQVGIGNQGR